MLAILFSCSPQHGVREPSARAPEEEDPSTLAFLNAARAYGRTRKGDLEPLSDVVRVSVYVLDPRDGLTSLLEALERLRYPDPESGQLHQLIVRGKRVRIVPNADAVEHWTAWWADPPK